MDVTPAMVAINKNFSHWPTLMSGKTSAGTPDSRNVSRIARQRGDSTPSVSPKMIRTKLPVCRTFAGPNIPASMNAAPGSTVDSPSAFAAVR